MTIGPVQLLVLGFDHPDFEGDILAELQRLRDNDLVRVVDGLVVAKDSDGNISEVRGSQLDSDEMAEFGAIVGALVGLGAEGEQGMTEGPGWAPKWSPNAAACSTRTPGTRLPRYRRTRPLL
jgi:hypothetical protein